MPKKKRANIPKKSKANKKENILLIDSEGNVITLAELPPKIPILPLYHRPMFPGILTMVGSSLATSDWIQKTLEKTDNVIGLLLVDPENQKGNGEWDEVKSTEDFYQMGTVAYVLNWVELPDKSCQFMLSTLQRFSIDKITKRKRHFMAEVHYIEEPEPLPRRSCGP